MAFFGRLFRFCETAHSPCFTLCDFYGIYNSCPAARPPGPLPPPRPDLHRLFGPRPFFSRDRRSCFDAGNQRHRRAQRHQRRADGHLHGIHFQGKQRQGGNGPVYHKRLGLLGNALHVKCDGWPSDHTGRGKFRASDPHGAQHLSRFGK